MTNPWFKFYAGDYLSEVKLKGVDANRRSCFVTALCYAAQSQGRIDTRYMTNDQLKIESGVRLGGTDWEETGDVYEWMEDRGFGAMDGTDFVFKNWSSRQTLTPYERVKRHREKMKNDNEMITTEQNRTEQNREDTQPWFENILNKSPEYTVLVKELAARDYLLPKAIHQILLEEMVPYYREKGAALKERWQKERSFDYLLRARTWLKKHHEYKKDVRCSENYWHRKGESCHHRPPDPDYKNVPVSVYAKNLNKSI